MPKIKGLINGTSEWWSYERYYEISLEIKVAAMNVRVCERDRQNTDYTLALSCGKANE